MAAAQTLTQTKVFYVPPETPELPFSPPYRSDTCLEHPSIPLQPQAKNKLAAHVADMHQEALMQFVRKVASCPEPIPLLVTPNCPPCHTEELRSERIHAVLQLLAQIRDNDHQSLLRRVYKTFGADHRKAAKALYAREFFSTAYNQYWSLFTCLSCDTCRRLSAPERHNLTVDLLEKLAVTSLRAGWLVDAEKFASDALQHEQCSTRARIWLATAQLGLGKLDLAHKNLALLPRRGDFPPHFPRWIEARVLVQRHILARLEREAGGRYDVHAMKLDSPDRTPDTPHSTALFQLEPTPAGLRTTAHVARDALLLVAPPLACVPCYTADAPPAAATTTTVEPTQADAELVQAKRALAWLNDEPESAFSLSLDPDSVFEQAKGRAQGLKPMHQRTLHDEDPSLLSLALVADTVYTQSKVLPHVRSAVRAGAMRCRRECEAVIDLVGNDLRAAAIVVAQNYTVSIPHVLLADIRASTSGTGSSSAAASTKRPAHAGHALYLPALKLISATPPNTYAAFHGPYLFLHAAAELPAGTLLTFDGFSGTVAPPLGSTTPRPRVVAMNSSPPSPKSSPRGLALPSS